MILGADYSWARPGGAALAVAGVRSVGRYLADEGDGREIELEEYQDLTAHGITVWFVREGYANGILDGHDKGVADAQIAVANLARLGLAGQVVYAACDFDIGHDPDLGSWQAQFDAGTAYMQGFRSVIGDTKTGIYGGMEFINHCRDGGLAGWFWKAAASSWDHGQGGAVHIEQTTQSPPVAGSDHNIIWVDNHGQAGYAPAPEERRSYDMPICYKNTDANPDRWILAGSSPGTTANWLETTNGTLGAEWEKVCNGSVLISAATYANFKRYYLMPLSTGTTATVAVDASAIGASVKAGVQQALEGLSFATAGTIKGDK